METEWCWVHTRRGTAVCPRHRGRRDARVVGQLLAHSPQGPFSSCLHCLERVFLCPWPLNLLPRILTPVLRTPTFSGISRPLVLVGPQKQDHSYSFSNSFHTAVLMPERQQEAKTRGLAEWSILGQPGLPRLCSALFWEGWLGRLVLRDLHLLNVSDSQPC